MSLDVGGGIQTPVVVSGVRRGVRSYAFPANRSAINIDASTTISVFGDVESADDLSLTMNNRSTSSATLVSTNRGAFTEWRFELPVDVSAPDPEGLSLGFEGVIIGKAATPNPVTHVLAIGTDDFGSLYPGRGYDLYGGYGAAHVANALSAYCDNPQVTYLPLSTAGTGQKQAIIDALSRIEADLAPGDSFLLYMGAHGGFMQTGNEPEVFAQNNPDNVDSRELTTGDEYWYLSRTNDDENITDNLLTSLLSSTKWDSADKLFLLDHCYSGGFFGYEDVAADLASLPNAGVISASTEANFGYAALDGTGRYWGRLGQSLVSVLGRAEMAGIDMLSYGDLFNALQVDASQKNGELGYVTGLPEDLWSAPVVMESSFSGNSTFNFGFALRSAVVPEPATVSLFCMGASVMLICGLYRRHKSSESPA